MDENFADSLGPIDEELLSFRRGAAGRREPKTESRAEALCAREALALEEATAQESRYLEEGRVP